MNSPRSTFYRHGILLGALAGLALTSAGAKDFYVDNIKGSDAGDGSEATPFQTVQKGADVANAGDTIYLVANSEPYREPAINFKKSGTEGAPIVLDGRGAILSGIQRFGVEEWKDLGGGVYSRQYENATHMKTHWEGGYDFVFFDRAPGTNVTKREDLVPFSYFMDPNLDGDDGKMLYICLPEGKTPADIAVLISRAGHSGLHVAGSHVTVKNLTSSNTSADGFSTTKGKNIIFENVRGCYNMDQGMSHHGSTAIVRNSVFDHNADAGIRDVWPDCESVYENCIFAYNRTSGIDAKGLKHTVRDSLFLNNDRAQVRVEKDSSALIEGCYFLAPGLDGVSIYKSSATLSRNTFVDLRFGFRAGQGTATLEGNAFLNNELPLTYFEHADAEHPTYESIKSDNNLFVGGQFRLGESKPLLTFADYQQQTGQDQNSVAIATLGETESSALPIKYESRVFGASVKAKFSEAQFSNPDPAVDSVMRQREAK